MTDVEVKEFGKHIVADPRICHGQWTFRGTRIMVWIVLDQVAREMPWETIVGEWGTESRRKLLRRQLIWRAKLSSRRTTNGGTRHWNSFRSPDEPAG
jgi:uncharacterized protein (DUF433 family)